MLLNVSILNYRLTQYFSLIVIYSQDCGSLTTPGNGSVQLTVAGTTTYGATATQSCNTGFDLTGVTTITCGADGNWSDPAITCTIKGNLYTVTVIISLNIFYCQNIYSNGVGLQVLTT